MKKGRLTRALITRPVRTFLFALNFIFKSYSAVSRDVNQKKRRPAENAPFNWPFADVFSVVVREIQRHDKYMFQIIARWRAKDGQSAEVMSLTREMQIATRRESGCQRYDVYQNAEDPHAFLLDELYVSQESAQVHRESEHFQRIVEAKIAPLLSARSSEKRSLV